MTTGSGVTTIRATPDTGRRVCAASLMSCRRSATEGLPHGRRSATEPDSSGDDRHQRRHGRTAGEPCVNGSHHGQQRGGACEVIPFASRPGDRVARWPDSRLGRSGADAGVSCGMSRTKAGVMAPHGCWSPPEPGISASSHINCAGGVAESMVGETREHGWPIRSIPDVSSNRSLRPAGEIRNALL